MKDILMVGFFTGVWATSSRTLLKDNKKIISKVRANNRGLYMFLKLLMYSPLSFFIMCIQTTVEVLDIVFKMCCRILDTVSNKSEIF